MEVSLLPFAEVAGDLSVVRRGFALAETKTISCYKQDCLQTEAVLVGHIFRNSLFSYVFTSVYMECYTADNQFHRIRLLSGGVRFLGFPDDELELYAANRSPICS